LTAARANRIFLIRLLIVGKVMSGKVRVKLALTPALSPEERESVATRGVISEFSLQSPSFRHQLVSAEGEITFLRIGIRVRLSKMIIL
jgi:hypothetical protein